MSSELRFRIGKKLRSEDSFKTVANQANKQLKDDELEKAINDYNSEDAEAKITGYQKILEIAKQHRELFESFTKAELKRLRIYNQFIKLISDETRVDESVSLRETEAFNKRDRVKIACSDGAYRSKRRRSRETPAENNVIDITSSSETQVSIKDLAPSSIALFRSLYARFPDTIKHRAQFGEGWQKAQAQLILQVIAKKGAVAVAN